MATKERFFARGRVTHAAPSVRGCPIMRHQRQLHPQNSRPSHPFARHSPRHMGALIRAGLIASLGEGDLDNVKEGVRGAVTMDMPLIGRSNKAHISRPSAELCTYMLSQ